MLVGGDIVEFEDPLWTEFGSVGICDFGCDSSASDDWKLLWSAAALLFFGCWLLCFSTVAVYCIILFLDFLLIYLPYCVPVFMCCCLCS